MRLLRDRRLVVGAISAFLVLLAACGTNKKASSPATSAPTTEAAATSTTKPASIPADIMLVAAPPKGIDPHNWGNQTQIAVTKSGTPVVVFSDLAGVSDDEVNNGKLLATHYDATSKKWSSPETITRGDFEPDRAGTFSLAADNSQGVLALTVEHQTPGDGGTGIDLYWSSDEGTTWAKSTVADGLTTATLPRVALGAGTAAVSYAASGKIHLATATFAGTAAPTGFHDAIAPGYGDTKPSSNDWAPTVGLNAKGKPVVAYYVPDNDGTGEDLAEWNGFGDLPNQLFESTTGQEHAYTAIARHGDTMVIASSLATSKKDDAAVLTTVTSTDGGVSWGKPVGVPNDDGSDPFDVSLALGGDSAAMAAYYPNSTGGGQKCAAPETPWTTNLTSWNACSTAVDDTHPSSGTNPYPAVTVASDGTYWVVYSVVGPSDTVPAGVFVRKVDGKDLRQRQASASDTGNPLSS